MQKCCYPEQSFDPEDWGCKKVENEFVPITTDLPVAPKYILQIIRCSCKTGCSSYRCSCRKNDMLCSEACTYCKINDCGNAETVIDENAPLEDEIYDE